MSESVSKPESLDSKIVEQLNTMCDTYARRKRLSADDRQEVFDHLEDTLHGYLSGQTRVTNEDALLLARARLGDVKGVVAQIAPQQSGRVCSQARRNIAITTALLTVIVLPLTIMALTPPAGRPSDFVRVLLLFPLCFVPIESGVFLAARTDMQSLWQRVVAFGFIVPGIAVFCLLLMGGRAGVLPNADQLNLIGIALVRGLAIACLAGHGILALMLLAPRKRDRLASAMAPVQ
jgi:hypothetical protein